MVLKENSSNGRENLCFLCNSGLSFGLIWRFGCLHLLFSSYSWTFSDPTQLLSVSSVARINISEFVVSNKNSFNVNIHTLVLFFEEEFRIFFVLDGREQIRSLVFRQIFSCKKTTPHGIQNHAIIQAAGEVQARNSSGRLLHGCSLCGLRDRRGRCPATAEAITRYSSSSSRSSKAVAETLQQQARLQGDGIEEGAGVHQSATSAGEAARQVREDDERYGGERRHHHRWSGGLPRRRCDSV